MTKYTTAGMQLFAKFDFYVFIFNHEHDIITTVFILMVVVVVIVW